MRFGAAITTLRWWRPMAVVLIGASATVACSGDGTSPLTSLDVTLPEGSRPTVTAPPAEEPAPEEPAPEEPAPEEPAPEEPAPEEPAPEEPAPEEPAPEASVPEDDEGLTTEEWTLLIVVGLVVLAIVIGAALLASRRTRRRDQQRTTHQRRLDDIVRECRSVHDSAVLSILQTSNPAMLQSTFAAARNQLIDLEGRATALATELPDESDRRQLNDLGMAVAGLPRRSGDERRPPRGTERAPAGRAHRLLESHRAASKRAARVSAATGLVHQALTRITIPGRQARRHHRPHPRAERRVRRSGRSVPTPRTRRA